MIKNCFEQLIVDNRKTQMLSKLLELGEGNRIFTGSPIQFLNRKESLLDLLPNILLVFSTCLNIRMTTKVKLLLQECHSSSRLGYAASKSEHYLRVVDQSHSLLVKYFEDVICFCASYVDPLLFDYSLKFFESKQTISIYISTFHRFLEE